MGKKTIRDLEVGGKRVIVRVDFNVPMKDGQVGDPNRIVQALPTIRYLVERNAKVILLSHLGKVNHKDPLQTEKDIKKNNARPIAAVLADLLKIPVEFCDATRGEELHHVVMKLQAGQVLLVQNTRYEKGEEKNDNELAKEWASLADAYVMDAFGSAHRAHASTYGIPAILNDLGKPTAIGFLVEQEIHALSRCIQAEEHPYVAILGGVKVSDKIKVIEGLLKKADRILIGGAMSYTFMKAKGVPVGNSLVEEEQLDFARKCMKEGAEKIFLPLDYTVAERFENPLDVQNTKGPSIPDGYMGMDLGKASIAFFAKQIKGAKVVFWNGPMGVFEQPRFSKGTVGIAKAIANLKGAFSVIGGGDSAAAVAEYGFKDQFSHVSTGGGASLEMIENDGHLPGIDIIATKGASS
jgi:phosphoglycerate kinase